MDSGRCSGNGPASIKMLNYLIENMKTLIVYFRKFPTNSVGVCEQAIQKGPQPAGVYGNG